MGTGPRGLIGEKVLDGDAELEIVAVRAIPDGSSLGNWTVNVREESATAITLKYHSLLTRVLQVPVPIATLELVHVQAALNKQ